MALGSSSRQQGALSEINVTPLVDVMLVLLVIFMITAPMMQQGVDVNLPKAKGAALPSKERVVVTVKKDGTIFINKAAVKQADLQKKLAIILDGRTDREVFLKADHRVSYGKVAKVMGEIKEAGVERLGMVTEPAGR